jgi:hypothetical protein
MRGGEFGPDKRTGKGVTQKIRFAGPRDIADG